MTNTSEINIPKHLKFAFGGLAGIGATCVVQPLDLVKNRMQTGGVGGTSKKYKTSLHAIRGIVNNEGFFSLYAGLSAGILRQATYTTTRLGVFTWLSEHFTKDGKQSNFVQKVAIGMTAGMIGAFVGTPSEVALIRMTLDASLPTKERRNYKNVVHALWRIVRDEGALALWRGAIPTMGRSMVVNGVQLSTYEQTKQILLDSGYIRDGVTCQFSSAMVSGLFTTATSLPVDITKTRIQNMKSVNGVAEYNGIADVFTKIVRNEGFFALWKGFTPYYARLGPHTVLTFLFFEQLKQAYRNSI